MLSLSDIADHVDGVTAGVVVAAFLFGLAVSFIGTIPGGEDGIKTWALTMLGFVGGIALLGWGFKEYRRRSLVTNTPTSRVRSLAQGLVELEGKALPPRGKKLYSPFSGEECVVYMYQVEEYRQQGKHSHWETIDAGFSNSQFYLDDGTGQVLVDSEGCDLRIPPDNVFKVGSFDQLPESAQQFIKEHPDVDTQEDEIFEEDRRYTEYYIAPGEHVYVFGEAFPREDHRGSSINPENAVINRDADTPMFIISDKKEEGLVSSMARNMYIGIFGGSLLAIGGFAALLLVVSLL